MSTPPSLHHDRETLPPPQMQQVDPGIYAYTQPDGSWGLSNAGLLVGSRYAIVIDTLFTEARNHAFREAAAGVTDVPITTVVNTHHHGDHVYGNGLYPQATIIGHELCRAETISTGLSIQPFFPTADFGHIDVTPAFVTFTDRLDVYVDDLKVELHFVGPAHTTNDVVAWIPERRLMFTGDIAFNGGTPFFIQGSLAGHITACERAKQFGAERIVPGHGPVCSPGALDGMIAYLRFIEHLAAESFAAGIPPLEAARRADLGEFARLDERERIVANLHRAYSELRGEPLAGPLPLLGIFAEMIEFNGGPVRCLA
jgi:cyclase